MSVPINEAELCYHLASCQEDDKRMGYGSEEAFAEVDTLSAEQTRRLAAIAVTMYDSPWTDRGRDLLRGVASVLRRESADEGTNYRDPRKR